MSKSHLFYQTRLRRPLLDRADGVYMWDTHGKRYLDGSSGAMVSNIGHSNPHVLAAMQAQMAKSTFGYRLHFETETAENLAARVAELSPEGHEKVFFVSGGSEAVESAIKLARQYAVAKGEGKRWQIISRSPSYHAPRLGHLRSRAMRRSTGLSRRSIRPCPRYRRRAVIWTGTTSQTRSAASVTPTCCVTRFWSVGRRACLLSSWNPLAALQPALLWRRTAIMAGCAKSVTSLAFC